MKGGLFIATDTDNKVLIIVINAYDEEGINKGVFAATTSQRAMEMISEIVEIDDEIVYCNMSEAYLNEVNSYVTLH